MRTSVAAALAAILVAGCATSTDGSPDRAQTSVVDPGAGTRSATDPAGSTVPPEEGTGGAVDVNTIDPCTLVTQDEADAITGVTVQKPQRALQLCTFPTPTSGSLGQLEVYVGDGAKKFFDIDKITLGHEFRKVPGVGDQAWAEDGAIFFHARGAWFGLRLTTLDSADHTADLAALAKTLIGRL